MRKQIIENAAYNVATQVRAVEDCIESALAEIADLQGKMIRARAVTGVGIAVGHPAFEQLVGATQGLVAAQRWNGQLPRRLGRSARQDSGPSHGRIRGRWRMPTAERHGRFANRRLSEDLTGSWLACDPVSCHARLHLYLILLSAVAVYALKRGDRDARITALACVGATAGTALVLSPLVVRYASVEMGVATIDVAVLAIFVAVALQSERFWPMWISGLQLTTTLGHFIKLIEPELLNVAYAAALRFWSYPILLILAIGTYRTRR